jgi:glycosyltransferase involved in cell wall biosynthesis
MRVLVVHNAYQQAGGEDAVVRAETALLRARGDIVQSYARSNDELLAGSGLKAGMAALWSKGAAADVDAICRSFRPDVIHVHNTFFVISPAIYWSAARFKVPVVQTLHNFRLMCAQGTFLRNGAICEDCVGKLPWRPVLRRCYRASASQSALMAGVLGGHSLIGTWRNKVTRYIALSAFARERFIAAGLPEERIRIKPNFVEGGPRPRHEGRRGGLFVGRLTTDKGVEVLLDALRVCGPAEMLVLGAGPLQSLVAGQLGAAYGGFASGEQVGAHMRDAAFLVVPSVGHEQMPVTVLEAFANGLPVIASRRGALADMVRDGVTGLLTDPDSASDLAQKIRWASDHPERMEEMGRAARAEYERLYTAPTNYKILREIYEDAISAAQGGNPVAQRGADTRFLDRCIGMGRGD